MTTKGLVWVALSILLLLPFDALGQSDNKTGVPRLPWGQPDLQGIWQYWTVTPLERPEEFADKAVVTPAEAAAYIARQHAESQEPTAGDWSPVARELLNGRTSLIIDPSGGRLPIRTEAGHHRADTIPSLDRPAGRELTADGPEDRDPWERCIMGRSVPFFPRIWDQRMQIVQTRDHVAIKDEDGEIRLIPVAQLPRLPQPIRQWTGSSRGHWDGDTLVVETTNFNGKWSFQGTGPQMRIVERFTRTAAGSLNYEFTVYDLESFTRAWTVAFPFTRDAGPIYEVACHEGNYSPPLMLSGARARERGTIN